MTTARMALILLFVLSTITPITNAAAQSDKSPAGTARNALPSPLTREAATAFVSGLDDRQARGLLLQTLGEEADRQALARSTRDVRNLGELATDYVRAIGTFLLDVLRKAPGIPTEVARTLDSFEAMRGGRHRSWLWLSLIASLAAGAGMFSLTRRVWPTGPASMPGHTPRRSEVIRARLLDLAGRMAQVVAFVLAAHVVNYAANASAEPDRTTIGWAVAIIGWSAVAWAMIEFILAPGRPQQRLCKMDDAEARVLASRLGLAILVFNLGFGFAAWLNRFGSPFNATWLGFWVNLAFHLLLVVTVWQGRKGVAQLAAGSTDPEAVRSSRLARFWPAIVIALIVMHWLTVELVVATSDVPASLFAAMAVTLALLVTLPLLNQTLGWLIGAVMPANVSERPALAAADEATRGGLLRVARVAGIAAFVFLILRMWNVDFVTLAEHGVGARLASSILNVLLVLGVAYGLWELVRIVTDRQIAHERVVLGLDVAKNDEMEGEGGGAGARLGTLLPLVRFAAEIAIVVFAGLTVLGELGVNIWPLLAGAGVVGLAIGFGAQALVKDIISGVFFLVDDATLCRSAISGTSQTSRATGWS